MDLRKIVRVTYIAYTIYIILLIGTTTLDFSTTSLAIMMMWINYIFFSFGYIFKKKSSTSIKTTEKKYGY